METAVREMPTDERWTKRSFDALKGRVPGMEAKDLRLLLHRRGAVAYRGPGERNCGASPTATRRRPRPPEAKSPLRRSGAGRNEPTGAGQRSLSKPVRGYAQRLMNSTAAALTSSGFDALRKCRPPSTTRSSTSALLTKSSISSFALATE